VSSRLANIAKIIFAMTNSKELFHDLVLKVSLPESKEEIRSIIYLLLESQLGWDRKNIMSEKKVDLNPVYFDSFIYRINKQEPIQYILGESEFYGRKFMVNPSVLIPRPETELLIQEVIAGAIKSPTILDVGTGSGCIAITLALEIPDSSVIGIDISEGALKVAGENAKKNNADVDFQLGNILEPISKIDHLDILVSNPPYITEGEKSMMKRNVLDHEPAIALFVSNDDPLLFYKAIARQGLVSLKNRGLLIVEINEMFAGETVNLLSALGYHSVEIVKDMDGKDRIVKAIR
jgi:release factor glutamine methyltransferase